MPNPAAHIIRVINTRPGGGYKANQWWAVDTDGTIFKSNMRASYGSLIMHFEGERGPREWVDRYPKMTVAAFEAFAAAKKK